MMKFCPNLNLPESKALIKKLGLLGFYKHYIQNNYNISDDIQDNVKSVSDLLFVNKNKFNAYQQQEIIKSILYKIQEYRNEGNSNVQDVIKSIKQDLIETELYFRNPDEFEATDETNQIADNIKNVIDNYGKFIEKVNKQLSSIGLGITRENKTINESNEEEESNYDSMETLFQKLNYDDESSFSTSSKDNASGDIKLALSLIPKYVYENGKLVLDDDNNPQEELNQIYLAKFEDLDSIWKDLLYTLIDVPIGQKLQYLKESTNPKHQVIYDAIISSPKTNIQNEFESVFSKQQANFTTVSLSKPDKSGTVTLKVFDTNRSNATNFLIDNWYEAFLQTDFVKVDKDGNQYVDFELGKKAKAIFDSNLDTIKSNPESKENIRKLLNSLGISVSPKILTEKVYVNKNSIDFDTIIKSKLKYFFNRLAGETKEEELEDTLEYNNPFIGETDSIELLAKLENKANPSVFEDSFVSGDNKAKYSFVNNSYLSHKIRQLKSDSKYINKLKQVPYTANSLWLINDAFIDALTVTYVDTLGNEKSNQTNKPFKRMSTREKEFSRIAMFQNRGIGTTKETSDVGLFVGLIPSDKTTIPVFKSLKIDVRYNDNRFNSEVIDTIYNQFISEYNRVKETFKQLEDNNVQKIAEYHTGAKLGTKFIIFPFLNKILVKDGQLLELDSQRLEDLVKPELESFLQDLVKQQISYWNSLNLNKKIIFDKSYSKKKGYKQDVSDNLEKLAADYAINYFVFFMNQTQLISGDPALHGKSVYDDKAKGIIEEIKSIDKTWVNYFKRMAKDIAPGLDGNFESDTFTTIFLKDLKYDTSHLNEYNEKIGEVAQSYTNMNPADAQEYTTLPEHLRVMDAMGRLTQEQKEAGERLINGGIDTGDIQLILQPVKPVYVTDKIEDNINKLYYIKTSSFPLIPALTVGLEIDKLRLAMEANGIDRAVYESGVKLGLQGELSNVSKDGFIKFNNLEISPEQKIQLSRSGFRIQQELPYHAEDNTILEGSQARKHIFNDLDDNDIITHNGKELKANEAKQLYEDLHIEKMNRAFDQFMEDISYDSTLNKITDLSKIEKILRDEAESREYSINDIYSIQVINDNGIKRFKVPLSFTNNSNRFESILNALVTNRVIKQELPGFSKVQGSGAGFSKIAGFDEANSILKSGITWLSDDTELKYIREENGKLVQADVLVPSWFKDSKGRLLNIRNFVKEDGTLDTDKLPEELLTVIGIRIPTQGYGSIMSFKVKGFLPAWVGDLAIVPSEIVAQMGSDFDVDKLFFYRYEYTYNKGVLTKVNPDITDISKMSEAEINNAIIQFFEDRYSDPKMLAQILEPNGFGKLPKTADIVSKTQKGNKSLHIFTTKEQNNIHKLNNDGKSGTGIFSLFSTFNRVAQDAKLRLTTPFKFKNSKDQVVELSNFYEVNNIEEYKKSSVILYLQSAAVDNSKEQILGKLNINDHTMGVAGTMAMLGLDEQFIGYFLSQPSIIEYVNKVSEAGDIIDGKYDPNAKNKAIRELISKYTPKDIDETKVLSLINSFNYGAKELLESLNSNIEVNALTTLTPEELNLVSNINTLFQLKVIIDFDNLREIADNIQTIQSAINVDTKGLGSSFTTLENKVIQIDKLISASKTLYYPILGVKNIFFNNNVISKSTQILKQTRNIYANVLSQGTEAYVYAVDKIFKTVDLTETDNNLADIYKNIKSYILSSEEIIPDIEEERKRLLYSKESLAKRWNTYSKSAKGRKNILTQRIKPRFSKEKGEPDLVTALNTPASNNAVDVNNSMMYFYDMIMSNDPEESNLAEDLVKYFIITGAQYGPSSIGKYISYDVLEKYDFSKKLRSIEDRLGNPQVLEGFIDQYFQNNPSKAKSFDLEKYPDFIEFKDIAGLVTRDEDLAGYIVSYDENKFEFNLYKNIGGLKYQKIPVLVNTKTPIKKYNFNSNNTSSSVEQKQTINIPTKKQITNTNLIEDKYNFDNGTEAILKSIINNTNNEYFRNIAIDLLSKGLVNVKVDSSLDRPSNGWYDSSNNTISINFENILRYTGKEDSKFEEVFLHELLHAGTVTILDNYIKLRQDNSPDQIVKKGIMTREQVIAANNINRLYEEYKKQYPDQEKLNKYIDINNRRLYSNITKDEMQFLVDNKSELYPLVNLDEFVAAGLTNPNFSNTLKSNNLWTKLVKFISDLLGINATDLDALYSNTINLIETVETLNNEDNISDDISEDNEYNRRKFIEQRNEFLRAYRVPKVNNGYGYDVGRTFSKEAQEGYLTANKNSKYDRIRIEFFNDQLRIKRVDPVSLFDDITDTIDTQEKRFIDRVLSRYKDNLKRLENKKKQLGDNAPADLVVKIENFKKKIAELTEKQSIVAIIESTENKIKEIKKSLNDDEITPDNLYEYRSYLNVLYDLNQQIEFDEEFEDLEIRLNNVSAEAVKLFKSLRVKEINLLQQVIDNKLDLAVPLKLQKQIEAGLKDVGTGESGFLDYAASSSSIIQSIGYLIEEAKFEANQKHDLFVEEFTPLLKEFLSKYKNYDILLQKDANGKPTGFLLNKYSQEYYRRSKKNFKFYNQNTVVEFTETGLEDYNADREIAKETLSDNDYVLWLMLHSPTEYIKDWKAGKRPKAKGSEKYLKIRPIDKWIDPNYKKLTDLGEEDPAVKFYNYIEPILRKAGRKHKQQVNYIPEISKSTLDYFLEGNVKSGISNIAQGLLDSITVDLDNSSNTEIDEYTGEPRLSIPVLMFSNKLKPEEKSYDLARIIEATQYQEYVLTAKREIEPLLNIYYAIIKDSKSLATKPGSTGEVLIDKAPQKMLDQSNFLIQSYLYNKTTELEGVSSVKIKGKNLAASKATDALINYVRIKGMAFNPFSAIGNIMQGLTSNFIYGSGGEYFNVKDQFKAFGLMLNSLAGSTSEARKISKLMRKFDAFAKANDLKFGTSRDIKSTVNSLDNFSWFELQQRGEYFIQGQTLLSVLIHDNYYNKFDENGNWTGEDSNPFEDPKFMYNYTQKVRDAIIDVHGNYVREIQNKKNFYWRAAMIFRTWLPQAINVRFGEQTTNILSGKTKKGRYRSYNSFIRNEDGKIDLNAMKDNILWLLGASSTNMTELDKINMRKNMAELALIAVITMLILGLKAAIEDFDDDEKNYTTYLINSLARTQNDLTFFMLPSSFDTIIKDPIPLMSTLGDIIDIFEASFATITGDPVYKTGPRKGKSRLYKEIVDNFPIINQIDKNIVYASEVMKKK